jgi:hypothetical protein
MFRPRPANRAREAFAFVSDMIAPHPFRAVLTVRPALARPLEITHPAFVAAFIAEPLHKIFSQIAR